ncbi:hypothetical protein ACQKKX_02170 [Neorhizobium sp. NPDC001467]|uniref:hypothetical protein n=1 Tax=Neorhizobium sp. NPDC001467 TaxID=3390595 RepID=UPI003D05B730
MSTHAKKAMPILGCLLRALTVMPLASSATLVHADTFLDGAYGNKEGCAYARTGESSGADVFFLLNAEGITTATAFCAFKDRPMTTAGGFKIKTQCESEGESGAVETVDLTKSARGYIIAFKDGTRWGPLPKCR